MTIFILSTSPFLLQLYNIMDVEKYSITKYLIPHFVITCLVIYIASLGIGIIGNLILDKTIFKLIDTKIKMKNI